MPRGNSSTVSIVDYSEKYGDAFARLNMAWLEKYFVVEPIDREVLSNPLSCIIEPGGAVLYACIDGQAVGTVALKRSGDAVFELTKMAVTERCQGLGIGRMLLSAAVGRFEEMQGKRLYLESNSALAPALALYESAGFRHEARPTSSDYVRSDVYMVYRPKQAGSD
ncbi:MAG: GNAT family N-acetyltransferase [Woeseiaceae bacterium]